MLISATGGVQAMIGQPQSVKEIEVRLEEGARLHGEVYGDRHAAVTVVLLHGWTLDRRTWHRQLPRLIDEVGAPTRVIAYDARGHGRSSPIKRHTATLGQLADDLDLVINRYAADGPVVLVGHSLGGMTVIEHAHRHPEAFADRIGGLVMVSTTAEGHTHTRYGLPAPLGRLVRAAELSSTYVLARCGERHPHRAVMNAIRPAMRWLLFGDPCDPDDLRLSSSAVARASLRSIGSFRPSISAQQRLDTLAALASVPSAVLVGERDRLTPVACARGIAEALGGIEVTLCAGAGHMLMMERPDEVTAAIAEVTREALGDSRFAGPPSSPGMEAAA
jgi:pimeloyl-ACP methyl ester carboxylesterase